MGKIRKPLFLFLRTFLFIYLGIGLGCLRTLKPQRFEAPAFLTNQIIPDHVRQEQLENAELSLNDDLDRDETIDRLDQDIDGDGILNLVDQAPFDAKEINQDLDRDGIPDWVDYSIDNTLIENTTRVTADLQKEIFDQYQVYVISDHTLWSETELRFIKAELAAGVFSKFKGLNSFTPVIVKTVNSNPENLEFGRYHPFWKTILIDSRTESLEEIFLHEAFHALRHFDSSIYDSFMKRSGWTTDEGLYETVYVFNSPENPQNENIEISEFDLNHNLTEVTKKLTGPWFPTEYSKLGPEEMFAECGVATLLKIRKKQNCYVQNQGFYQTLLFKWFSSL